MRGALIAVAAFCLITSTASAASQASLTPYEARSAAEAAALDFQIKHDLDSNSVGVCSPKTVRRSICEATVKGETDLVKRTCRLRISVRSVYRTFYWDQAASIVQKKCQSERKPHLLYPEALAAIQQAADELAGRRTVISGVYRVDDVTYSGFGEWIQPKAVPSPFSSTESCSATFRATLANGRISVGTEGYLCF